LALQEVPALVVRLALLVQLVLQVKIRQAELVLSERQAGLLELQGVHPHSLFRI
jgi:hypothetical protein